MPKKAAELFDVGLRTCPVTDFAHLTQRQLVAVDQFQHALRDAERAAGNCGGSREERMDASRRLDVVRRTEQALLERAELRLREAGNGPWLELRRTALVAHRQEWFSRKVSAELTAAGVEVLGRTTIGAEAVGWAILEQPDIVIVEDTLMMLTGEQTVRELRRYCQRAVIGAVVRDNDQVGRMLDAGASTVHARATPPALLVDLVTGLAANIAVDRGCGSTGAVQIGTHGPGRELAVQQP